MDSDSVVPGRAQDSAFLTCSEKRLLSGQDLREWREAGKLEHLGKAPSTRGHGWVLRQMDWTRQERRSRWGWGLHSDLEQR